MENTSISNLILPTPFNQKTSHNFQLVHSKVNRFSISDLYHLSIWLSRAVFHHGHGSSPVVIYCEVVIVTVTKTAKRLLYLCALSSWPRECPSFEKCAWLLKKKPILRHKMSLCAASHRNIFFFCLECVFVCFLLSVLDVWFLCYTTVASSSNYLEQKSQQLFQKTVSVIIWHLNNCFHKNRAALSVARIGLKRTHSVKTAWQIPLTETPRARQRMCCSPLRDWTGSGLLFHRTPQKMVFPCVACNQVHVFAWPLMPPVSRAGGIDREASGSLTAINPRSSFSSRVRKVLKNALNVAVAEFAEVLF